MKDRSLRSGDAEAHVEVGRVHTASMQGRRHRGGDSPKGMVGRVAGFDVPPLRAARSGAATGGLVELVLVVARASMKGSPLRGGDQGTHPVQHVSRGALMKGRPRRGGDEDAAFYGGEDYRPR